MSLCCDYVAKATSERDYEITNDLSDYEHDIRTEVYQDNDVAFE